MSRKQPRPATVKGHEMGTVWIDTSGAPSRPVRLQVVADEGNNNVPEDDEPESSWQWVNLKERWLTRGRPLVTTICCVTSGLFCLFYSGKINAVYGRFESGKTWLMKLAVKQQILAGCHVFYLDFEDDDIPLTGDLLKLGVDLDTIDEFVHYMSIEDACDTEAQARLFADAKKYEPTLVVVDGTTEAMSAERLKVLSSDDFATFVGIYVRKLARLGLAVVLIDHPAKADTHGESQFGAMHKGAVISGAQYFIQVVPGEPFRKGKLGKANIFGRKDRPGSVRPFEADPQTRWLAQLVLDSSNEDDTSNIYMRPVIGTDATEKVKLDSTDKAIMRYLTDNREKWFKATDVQAGAALAIQSDTVKRRLEVLHENAQQHIDRKQEHDRAPVWFGYFPDGSDQ